MSKDVVIAGAIVAACLGLVTVAFVLPKHNKKAGDSGGTDSELIAKNNEPPNAPPVPEPQGLQPEQPPLPPNGLPPFQPQGPGGPHPITPFPNQQPTLPQPLPPIEPPSPPSSEVRVHVVAAHETLGEISMKYYGTSRNWKKIAEVNKVDPSELQPGQKLTIPVIEGAKVSKDGGTPPVEPGAGEHIYKVKTGDSYYTIAKHELGNANRWKELEKLNGISPEELHAGQTIKLPVKEGPGATPPGAPLVPPPGGAGENPVPGDGRTHVVAKGDTLAGISKKYFGTTTKWKEIVKLNPGVDPETLKEGQKLILPEGAGAATAAPAPGGSAPAQGESGFGEYTVLKGDTLESIAVKELGGRKGVKRIIEANPGLDPTNMRLGQKIKIPGKSKQVEPAPPAPAPAPSQGFGTQPGFGVPPTPAPTFGPPGAGLGPALPPANGSFGTPSYPAPPGPAVQPTFGTPPPAKPAFTQ
jgi:LysM repeat protein